MNSHKTPVKQKKKKAGAKTPPAAPAAPAAPKRAPAPPSVFIATPVYGDPTAPNHDALIKLIASSQKSPIPFMHMPQYDMADHYKSYDHLTRMFLDETRCDFILYIDHDICRFTLKDILRMLNRNEPFISGYYVERNEKDVPRPILQTLDGKPFNPALGAVQEVKRTGAGFLLVRRDVLQKIIPLHPELVFISNPNEGGNTMMDFFHVYIDQETRERVSGDFALCDRAREAGYKVMIDAETRVGHYGRKIYMPPTKED
jgi:hypothetical protein